MIIASFVLLATIFVAFTAIGSPLFGIGHFFYVPITLFALVTSARAGFAMGAAAAVLYALGIVLNPSVAPTEVLTVGTAIRFGTYTAMGALAGGSRATTDASSRSSRSSPIATRWRASRTRGRSRPRSTAGAIRRRRSPSSSGRC